MDDPHVEITDMRRPDDPLDLRHPSRMGAHARRGRRLAVAIGSIVLAVLVMAGPWRPLHERGSNTGAQSRHATPLPTETTRPTPTAVRTATAQNELSFYGRYWVLPYS